MLVDNDAAAKVLPAPVLAVEEGHFCSLWLTEGREGGWRRVSLGVVAGGCVVM